MITYILSAVGQNCTHISTYAERYPLGQALSHRLNVIGGAA
mgnify:FL=1